MLASLLLTFPSIYHHILPCILSAASRHWAGTFTHSLSHLLTHSLPLFLRVCLYLLSVRAFCLPSLGVRRKGPEVGQVASVSLTKLDTKVCSLTFLFLSLSLSLHFWFLCWHLFFSSIHAFSAACRHRAEGEVPKGYLQLCKGPAESIRLAWVSSLALFFIPCFFLSADVCAAYGVDCGAAMLQMRCVKLWFFPSLIYCPSLGISFMVLTCCIHAKAVGLILPSLKFLICYSLSTSGSFFTLLHSVSYPASYSAGLFSLLALYLTLSLSLSVLLFLFLCQPLCQKRITKTNPYRRRNSEACA